MHQYKTIAQTLVVLSILNSVSAAPAVPLEVRDTGNDVVVKAADVTTVSERRRGIPPPGGTTGTTPSQYSSPLSDGSPPQDSLPLHESGLSQGSAPSSHLSATDEQVPVHDSITQSPTFAHPLSATDEQVPVHDSITQSPTFAHPLSAALADGPAPVPNSDMEASASSHPPVPVPGSTAQVSTTSPYTAVTYNMLDKDPPSQNKLLAKKIAGFALIGTAVAAIVLFSALHNRHNDYNSTTTGG